VGTYLAFEAGQRTKGVAAPVPDEELTAKELKSEDCLFQVDVVPRQKEMTAFKRRARLHQAQWRKAEGLPMGGHLQRDGTRTPVGSRLDLATAKASMANFLSPRIADAVMHRLAHPEPRQMIQQERLWSDLLSSMPMCFNLFGELWDEPEQAAAALRSWFPDTPGAVQELRFEWSPGRLDPEYLGNRSAFDAVFLLEIAGGGRGVLGVECKYHEHAKAEKRPSGDRMKRYLEVTERSGIFGAGWEQVVVGTDLQQLWVDHLLVLSMAQHPRERWSWVKFVVIHPEGNTSFGKAVRRYRDVLTDHATFEVRSLEQILSVPSALPSSLVTTFRRRYLW
jgi:hypothetical protein